LVTDAKAYADSLPGDHPLEVVLSGALEARERVWADPKRVGQVLRNLLSNAAKYSPDGTSIELRATTNGSGHVRIEVADHGPGIHPEEVARIFEKFGRGSSREGKKVAGAGLGLYLSRRIVQAHGGELTLDTQLGEGSVFGFDLEVAK
jgi:signal transduction histidine kinase